MDKWAVAGRLVGIGWYIGLCIVLGVMGGIWFDRKFDTAIIFTMVGLFLGLTLAFLGSYRMISPLLKEHQDEDKEDN